MIQTSQQIKTFYQLSTAVAELGLAQPQLVFITFTVKFFIIVTADFQIRTRKNVNKRGDENICSSKHELRTRQIAVNFA